MTARSREAASAAELFATRLGLAEIAVEAGSGLTAAAVTAGGVRLRFVAADPRSASPEAAAFRTGVEALGEGLAGLVLEVRDVDAAARALARLSPREHAGVFCLDSERCHGVPLTFRPS